MADNELAVLADRVEGLTGPRPMLAELILLATGWTLERAQGLGERATWVDPSGQRTARRQGDGWFDPFTSLDAAMTLVPDGWGYTLVSAPGHKFEAIVREWQQDDKGKFWTGKHMAHSGDVIAATMPRALCAAALRAAALRARSIQGKE